MKNQIIFAILLSIVVIVLSSLIILKIEPSNKTQPYFHDRPINELENHLVSMKKNESSDETLFNNLMDIDSDTLKYIIGIEPEYLEDSVVKASSADASMLLILKPKKGASSLVEASVLEYMDYLEKQWNLKDKHQAELVQNYSKITMGDYLIYVVSENNEYVKDALNSFFIFTDK